MNGDESAKNTRKITEKNHNLRVYEFETIFMTEIGSIDYGKVAKKLLSLKSIRDLVVWGLKGDEIAKNTRKIPEITKLMSLLIRDKFYEQN